MYTHILILVNRVVPVSFPGPDPLCIHMHQKKHPIYIYIYISTSIIYPIFL